MRLGIVVAVSLGCLGLSACAGDSEDGDDGGGDDEGVDWSTANPPPNIDITSCADIRDFDDGSECSACCTAAGFPSSSSLYDDRCTCGSPRDDMRDTVCTAAADPASGTPCQTCCSEAGFSGYAYFGGAMTASCSCFGHNDDDVCVGSLQEPTPDEACFLCCLNHGFIGAGYSGFGEETCSCMDP